MKNNPFLLSTSNKTLMKHFGKLELLILLLFLTALNASCSIGLAQRVSCSIILVMHMTDGVSGLQLVNASVGCESIFDLRCDQKQIGRRPLFGNVASNM